MTNEELVYMYQNGDKKALDALIEQNKGIVFRLVNKFYIEGINSIDREDLEQEGYIGLMIAAKKFNPNLENAAQFISYAVYWIYSKMHRYVVSKDTNNEVSLNSPINDDADAELGDIIESTDYGFENVEDKLYNLRLHDELEEVMSENNTLREREILKLRYGWDNNKCMTLADAGEIFHITKEMVRQIETRALTKIRHTKWARLRAQEMGAFKKEQARYSISAAIESMNFAQKYLL